MLQVSDARRYNWPYKSYVVLPWRVIRLTVCIESVNGAGLAPEVLLAHTGTDAGILRYLAKHPVP